VSFIWFRVFSIIFNLICLTFDVTEKQQNLVKLKYQAVGGFFPSNFGWLFFMCFISQ